MGVVHGVLEGGYRLALLVSPCNMSHISVWLVLEHPGLGDHALHLLEHSSGQEQGFISYHHEGFS